MHIKSLGRGKLSIILILLIVTLLTSFIAPPAVKVVEASPDTPIYNIAKSKRMESRC